MSEPKKGPWILRSIAPVDPINPYVGDDTCQPILWAPWQREAFEFTSAKKAHAARRLLGDASLRVFRLVPKPWLPWSDGHVKAAKIECCRWGAEEMETGIEERAEWMIAIGQLYAGSDVLFMRELALLLPTQREIDRFRRRIENRALGLEEVAPVEEFFRVRLADNLYVPEQGDNHEAGVGPAEAHESERGTHMDQVAARILGARVVQVKLKRRRTLRKAAS